MKTMIYRVVEQLDLYVSVGYVNGIPVVQDNYGILYEVPEGFSFTINDYTCTLKEGVWNKVFVGYGTDDNVRDLYTKLGDLVAVHGDYKY